MTCRIVLAAVRSQCALTQSRPPGGAVGQQIEKDLFELPFVGLDGRKVVGYFDDQM
jgi:hypothetical protein